MHFLLKSFALQLETFPNSLCSSSGYSPRGGFPHVPGEVWDRGGGIPTLQGDLSHNQELWGALGPTEVGSTHGPSSGRTPPHAVPQQCQGGGPRPGRGWQHRAWPFPGETPGSIFPWLSASPLLACTQHALPGCFQSPRNALEQQPRLTRAECAASAPAWGASLLPLCSACGCCSQGAMGQKVPFFNGLVTCSCKICSMS